jgi:hypothetical protein
MPVDVSGQSGGVNAWYSVTIWNRRRSPTRRYGRKLNP